MPNILELLSVSGWCMAMATRHAGAEYLGALVCEVVVISTVHNVVWLHDIMRAGCVLSPKTFSPSKDELCLSLFVCRGQRYALQE